MDTLINQSATWNALEQHQQYLASIPIRDLFALDNQRFEKFSLEACDLLLDYSKNRLTSETLTRLQQFAQERQLKEWIIRLFHGEKVNHTEQRAALHIALRNRANTPIKVDGQDVMPAVNAVLNKIRQLSESVRSGEWRGYTGKPIEYIINIGIGGSDLGPALVARALKAYWHPRLRGHFVSNVDSTHLVEILTQVNPETTLFIIASKTFTTQETLLNAQSARQWLIDKLGNEAAVAKHFVAVSTARQKVIDFGIDPANMFEFWDWVGGRYSLWSAIGLPITLLIGMDNFESFLTGAHELDNHFATAPFDKNLPVLMGLIEVWYNNFWGAKSQAVLPYDYALELLPAYLQQLAMESLGKRVTREGKFINYSTAPILWGAPGNNGQHAFYQLLHQGTHLVPTDFILAIESQHELPNHQEAVISNALAQTHVLMKGRTAEETKQALLATKMPSDSLNQQIPHRLFPGNQPSNTLVYQKLTPQVLGTLLALYEHKVFVESVCWNINPFDQWGVELGKQVANSLLPELAIAQPTTNYDASTNGLLNYIKTRRRHSEK
jgi:glucose-6-phosphate isomerase